MSFSGWIVIVAGVYFAGTSVYNMIMTGNTSGYIVNGIGIGFGVILIGIGYSMQGSSIPVVPTMSAPAAPTMGGRRRR
uniref:Uncharacterized protein n=1 Tax=viral metagenome TaxID=1070528 RepID=A0A6C0JVG2_9ZZZZ